MGRKLSIEQKIARYLAWDMRSKDYDEMAQSMNEDREAFNQWVSQNAHFEDNTK